MSTFHAYLILLNNGALRFWIVIDGRVGGYFSESGVFQFAQNIFALLRVTSRLLETNEISFITHLVFLGLPPNAMGPPILHQ